MPSFKLVRIIYFMLHDHGKAISTEAAPMNSFLLTVGCLGQVTELWRKPGSPASSLPAG